MSHQTIRNIDLGDNRSLAYVEAGVGQPIILLHGALTHHEDWLDEPFNTLSALGRVIAIDRPGHGQSRRPRFRASAHEQARQLHDGLNRLGVDRPLLVGHSMGGLVAMAYAADFATEVAGLVLVAPIAFPELRPLEHTFFAPRSIPVVGPIAAEMARVADAAVLSVVHRAMFAPQPVPSDWRERYPYKAILTAEAMVQEGEDAASILPGAPEGGVDPSAIRCPVRILAGDADRVALPSRHARRLAAALPKAELAMIEGEGHMLHVCRPERVIEAVRDLLPGATGKAGRPARTGARRKMAA
jgi:pimeloyl-ACP methyl ester carboxylesterase